MLSSNLITGLLIALAGLAAGVVGFALGTYFLQIRQQLKRLSEQVAHLNDDDDDTDTSGVVETTPNLIREKERKGQLTTEDSAIVEIKNPKQMKADKERRMSEQLDRLGR